MKTVFASNSVCFHFDSPSADFHSTIKTTERALNIVHKSISAKDVKDKLFLRVFLSDGVKQREIILVFPVMGALSTYSSKTMLKSSNDILEMTSFSVSSF